jgi:hypothetical protein
VRAELSAADVERLAVRRVTCPITKFREWLSAVKDLDYPVEGFTALLGEFAEAEGFASAKDILNSYFGIIDGEVKWVKIGVLTNVAQMTAGVELIKSKEAYDRYVEFRNEDGPKEAAAIHTSMFWLRAELETSVVDSTLAATFVSVGLTTLILAIFTGSLRLSLSVVVIVAGTLTCITSSLVVGLEWQFGATEALMLIVLLGFAVDYSLHVGEAFQHVPEPKIENTLNLVGMAVVSAAITTFGTAFFLLFCHIQLLARFGTGIMLCTFWSLVFSLLFFPPFLSLIKGSRNFMSYLRSSTASTDDDDDPPTTVVVHGPHDVVDSSSAPRRPSRPKESSTKESSTGPPGVDWQYEIRPGEWRSYNPQDLGDVESLYVQSLQGGSAIHQVTLGGNTYSLHFQKMTQMNTSIGGRSIKKIRRTGPEVDPSF